MRTAELLNSIATWLESANNEAMLLAENDPTCLQVVAESCVLAAALLKQAAEQVDLIEPPEASLITPESIEETASLASILDGSGIPALMKQASVLDELLMTIAAPPNAIADKKAADDDRIETLRRKYEQPQKDLRKINKIQQSEDAIDKSGFTKEKGVEIGQNFLQTRTCPDHPGAQMQRVGEGVFMCEMDNKKYDYRNGYTLIDNKTHVPGGSVALQTPDSSATNFRSMFDTRSERLENHEV